MKNLLSIAAATLLAATSFATAAEFSEVDANSDGWVTPEEFAAAVPGADEAAFVAIDTNGDGAISEDEMAAYAASEPNTSG